MNDYKTNIGLRRQTDTFDLIHRLLVSVQDNHNYDYFYESGYVGGPQINSFGWSNDAFCIYHNENIAGYIYWQIDQMRNQIDSVSIKEFHR